MYIFSVVLVSLCYSQVSPSVKQCACDVMQSFSLVEKDLAGHCLCFTIRVCRVESAVDWCTKAKISIEGM